MKVLITDYVWPNIDVERRILSEIGAEVVVSPSKDEATLSKLAADADAIITCFAPVTRKVLESAPKCLHISRYGIGVDNIDVAAATDLGMTVTNIPAYCVDEVAEHAMGLMMALNRKFRLYDSAVRQGHWDNLQGQPIYRIKGSILGILGFGKVGRTLARKVAGLEMRILAWDPYLPASAWENSNAQSCDFDTLLAESDFISVHSPLTEETRGIIGEAALRKMKKTAYLINTARGPIVDVAAVEMALREGWIAGAALDTLPSEPPAPDSSLLKLDNLILTPHSAFYSEQSLLELQSSPAQEVVRVLTGQRPVHLVNPEMLPKARASHLRG